MGLWEKLTECEKNCCCLHRNGFTQVDIASINVTSIDTVSSHLHSAKRKGKCKTITEVIADLVHEGHLPKMHLDDRKILEERIILHIKKYGKPKKKEKPKPEDYQDDTLNKKTG